MVFGVFKKIRSALSRTQQAVGAKISALFRPGTKLSEQTLEELEEILILADVGTKTSALIIEDLKREARRFPDGPEGLTEAVKAVFSARLATHPGILGTANRPAVILLLGVNGTGKTTTSAKLCQYLKKNGKTVLLAAADTYRAGAIEQLRVWADRAGVGIVAQQSGSDAASVAFDAVEAALARGIDYVIVDTAGRLHTKTNLMEELAKIKKVVEKKLERPADETFLVLDATTGRNGLNQAQVFNDKLGLTGLILTKLDSSAKGGVALSIRDELNLPIAFIGTGETLDDLEEFSAEDFTNAFFPAAEPPRNQNQ